MVNSFLRLQMISCLLSHLHNLLSFFGKILEKFFNTLYFLFRNIILTRINPGMGWNQDYTHSIACHRTRGWKKLGSAYKIFWKKLNYKKQNSHWNWRHILWKFNFLQITFLHVKFLARMFLAFIWYAYCVYR